MKTSLLAVAVTLLLPTSLALAGEGNGEPFPYHAPGVTTVFKGQARLVSKDQDPFPYRGAGTVVTPRMTEQVVPDNSAESGVQTANALPPRFSSGSPAYARTQSTLAYAQAQARQHLAARPHPAGPGGNG